MPDGVDHRGNLARSARGLPTVVEIRHRHVVERDDLFEMAPGFVNFDPIEAGQVVARDERGGVPAPEAGLMMLPRYQGQGEDGFFVARSVAPFWLWLSRWLRRLRLDRVVPMLPGVARDRSKPDTFLTNPPGGPLLGSTGLPSVRLPPGPGHQGRFGLLAPPAGRGLAGTELGRWPERFDYFAAAFERVPIRSAWIRMRSNVDASRS